jgi:hypothetical protein
MLSAEHKWRKRADQANGRSIMLYSRADVEATLSMRKNGPAIKPGRKPGASAAVKVATPTPPPKTSHTAPAGAITHVLRVCGDKPGEVRYLECTAETLDDTYQALIAGGTPATAMGVYRLAQTRLKLELVA